MDIKFSDELNAVLNYSRQEAQRTGNFNVEPDHFMLGILRHTGCMAYALLKDIQINTDSVKKYIDEKITTDKSIPYSELENISFSRSSQNLISIAILEAGKAGQSLCTSLHLLLGLMRTDSGFGASYIANGWGVTYDMIKKLVDSTYPPRQEPIRIIRKIEQVGAPAEEGVEDEVELSNFGTDLTDQARAGLLDPVVGREDEMDRLMKILARRKKNSAMLVGEAGVGKSAVVEGLSQRIAAGKVPSAMKSKKIFMLDIASVVAGTKFRGEFEKRLKNIINAISSRPEIILFIDEFHTIVGAGKSEGGLDAANILKPALARGAIQCLGATTVEEYTRYVEKDAALERRFQKVLIEKTDIEQTLAILKAIKPKYEEFHHVTYPAAALDACVRMSERYISGRCLPDKAVDVMDDAGATVRMANPGKKATIGVDDIAGVISKITGIPVGKIAQSEAQRLVGLADMLKETVIGQDDAIERIAKAICRSRAGIKDPNRPIGSFLFMGPTGVGKTLLAKSLAENLFDSADNMVRIDMSEYMEKFAVTRLIGAPPGYIGFDDNGQLTEPVRQKPYCVVLLDEIEKAHPDIFNLLLQVMDEGRLTDSHGRTVSFRNTILIMTSNVGSRDVAQRGSAVGFAADDPTSSAKFSSGIIQRALDRTFPPEFLGRLDDRIEFKSLSKDDVSKIIDLEIAKIRSRVEQNGYKLKISAATKKKVALKGFDPRFGARPLRRAILELIEDPVSEKLIQARLSGTITQIISV